MEAASLPRPRNRRRPSWRAPLALLLYTGALFFAWSLVNDAGDMAAPAATAASTAPSSAIAPTGSDLALTTLATRASRSVVRVGGAHGFVAWTTNGLSLVVTARPAAGWKTGADRAVTVVHGGAEHEGKLVRADPKTGLGLVRVEGELARPLWQRRAATPLAPGDRLAIAAGGKVQLFTVANARHAAIWGAGAGTSRGQPVLNESGRVVGVTTGSRVVPIGRACGPIRRC